MDTSGTALKALLRQRHLQEHRAFCRAYDKAAKSIDPRLVGSAPSKATFYRWLSGDIAKLPYPSHCQVLETMLPGWTAPELFKPWSGDEPPTPPNVPTKPDMPSEAEEQSELVKLYPYRSAVPSDLWDKLLKRASQQVDILVYVGMFMTEKPNLLATLKKKAEAGAQVRLLFGDRDSIAVIQRSRDENIGEGTISAKIDHAIAHFKPLKDVEGIEVRTHGTVLYNSIYRFDDEMIVNPHVFGKIASHAPAMHLHRLPTGDMFSTYADSFDEVWKQGTPHEW